MTAETFKILHDRRQTETKGLRAIAALAFGTLVSPSSERASEVELGAVWMRVEQD